MEVKEYYKQTCILDDCDTFSLGKIKCGGGETIAFQEGYWQFYNEFKKGNIEKLLPLKNHDCGRYGERKLYIEAETKDGQSISLTTCYDGDDHVIKTYKLLQKCINENKE